MSKKMVAKIKADADVVVDMTKDDVVRLFKNIIRVVRWVELRVNGFTTFKDKDGNKVFAEALGDFPNLLPAQISVL